MDRIHIANDLGINNQQNAQNIQITDMMNEAAITSNSSKGAILAMHKIHMEKEEFHLLPYFLQNVDDTEISELIRQPQTTI